MSESRAEKSALPLLFFGEVDRYRKRHPFKDLSFYRDYLLRILLCFVADFRHLYVRGFGLTLLSKITISKKPKTVTFISPP